ncbi:MAG: glycosyltransferase family 4 protein [Spirochaetaceae bacterium]|jgi:hypothetical protein|nr:glycosyltransferase family 4 protein [Spirochaetaceae bacterium]
MKNLLFITAFPPNNKSGGQTLSLDTIKDLSKKYIIDLIYFDYKNHTPEKDMPVNVIKNFKVNNFNCLLKIDAHPVFTRRFNKNILRCLRNIALNYDVLFFDYSQTGLYAAYLEHPCKVLRLHDVMFQKFSRKNRIFKPWIKLTEKKTLLSVNKVFVLSQKDADIVKKIYNMDVHFTDVYIKDFVFFDIPENINNFVFYGVWSRPENLDGLLWFIKKVPPLISPELKIKFSVMGGALEKKIEDALLKPAGFEYLGFCENPLDVIYSASALIAPVFTGAGVKIKVIDAFTTGTPVIGTEAAFEGLPAPRNLAYMAHKPREYADVINKFQPLTRAQKEENAAAFMAMYGGRGLSRFL